jgi:hypothetical protein
MRRRGGLTQWRSGLVHPARGRRLARLATWLLGWLMAAWLVWASAGLYVEWVWFESLGYPEVLARQAWTQAALFVGGALGFGGAYAVNLRLARRLADGAADTATGEEALWTYLARVSAGLSGDAARGRLAERALLWLGAGLAVAFGLAAADEWALWLTALHGVPFGVGDPLFGLNAGFYVYLLPLLRELHRWLVGALLVIAGATVAFHLSRGRYELGLDARRALVELNHGARLHLAGLAAGLFLLAAAHHQLSLAEVALASSGQAFGFSFPGYAAANAQVPALRAMTLAAVAAAGFLTWAAPEGRPRRLALGPLLWLAMLLFGSVYPSAIQALVVKPNEAVMERPYLARVAAMTRAAYGLDGLAERPLELDEPLRAEVAREHLSSLANVRLWEPDLLQRELTQLQAFKPYYGFPLPPDLDRYDVGGRARAVFVAVRELDPRQLPAQTWVNTHLQFTHGYGVVALAASAVGADDRPLLLARDLPPQGELPVTRPEVYFGERTTGPVLVRTSEAEIDYPRGDAVVSTRYEGRAGSPIGDPLARLAHALRLGDLNLAISPAIQAETALLHRRQVADRVQRLAPFLLLDADPYPVVHDGRIVWMLDGYTSSSSYPFAPRAPARLLARDPRPGVTRTAEPNYLRGAVKATVDAYDGTVSLYVADPDDPIVATYRRIYPGLLQSLEAMPAGLRSHLRYPQQLFSVQAEVLGRFHVEDPARLYSGEDAWSTAHARFSQQPDARPSYGLVRLPDDASEEFVLTTAFRPYSQGGDRQNLVGLLAARSGPARYGELVLYRSPRERPTEGPLQAWDRISRDQAVQSQTALWRRTGALVEGDIQTLLLGNSVVYAQAFYLQRIELPADRTALHELQRVAVVSAGRVAMEPTLEQALSSLVGAPIDLASLGLATAAPPGRPDRLAAARELALSAQEHLQRAQEAQLAGDRARADQELRAALADLQRLSDVTR